MYSTKLFVSKELSDLLHHFVLINHKKNPFILANRFVFPVRNHPHLSPSISLKSSFLFLFKLLYHLFYSFFVLPLRLPALKVNCSSLFVSNLVHLNTLRDNNDLYYHKFPFTLATYAPVVITYFSGAKISNNRFLSSSTHIDNIYRCAIYKHFSFYTFFRSLLPAFRAFSSLIALTFQIKNITSKLYLVLAAFQSFSPSSFSNIQSVNDIVKYARFYNVDRIFYTFEGHAWEKLLNYTIKTLLPSVQAIAYNHTVIFANSDTLARSYSGNLDPDSILTVGDSTAEKFRLFYPPSKSISCIGSQKVNHNNPLNNSVSTNLSILFLPEGFLSEVYHHIDLAKSLADKFPRRNFIIRLHPCLSTFSHSIQQYIQSLNFANLSLSSLSFSQDIDRSSYAVYTGSTAILEGMFYNLFPIYYPHPDGFNLNPLHSLGQDPYPLIASNVGEFDYVFKSSSLLPPPSSYAIRLLSPFNTQLLQSYLT